MDWSVTPTSSGSAAPATSSYTKKTEYGIPYTDYGAYQTDLQKWQQEQMAALEKKQTAATKAREKQISAIYDSIISMFGAGGSYGQGVLASLDRQKTQDVASAAQSMVDTGLYGTTTTAGLGKKWEEEIGVPSRMKLEDVKAEKLSTAKLGKAQFLTNIEQPTMDYGLLSQLIMGGYGAA